jgi:hypothetical protein
MLSVLLLFFIEEAKITFMPTYQKVHAAVDLSKLSKF